MSETNKAANKVNAKDLVIVVDEFAELKDKLEGEPNGAELINKLNKYLEAIVNLRL
ncbi:hypothetical protein [Nostoc sp. MG11]|uniref:hypothetical protein n=1 Tax=Nostoc sp. MG11 TaxID=2721166 RepID=UPI001868F518|nr:hypothetical protein [Nostoc sp. MG11]